MRIEEELGSVAQYKGKAAFYNVKAISAAAEKKPAKKSKK